MTTRADVVKEIQTVDARVSRLAPQILAKSDAKLRDGVWKVRQVLCHIAARANGMTVATAAAQRARAAKFQAQPDNVRRAFDIDEINQRQIDDRQNSSIQEILDEIHAGHQAAWQAVRDLDQPALEERLPSFTGVGDMSFADLLVRAGPGHENHHLDQIEQAMEG